MIDVEHQEQANREKFLFGLLTDECKTCEKEDLMQWWAWRDQQWGVLARLENLQ